MSCTVTRQSGTRCHRFNSTRPPFWVRVDDQIVGVAVATAVSYGIGA